MTRILTIFSLILTLCITSAFAEEKSSRELKKIAKEQADAGAKSGDKGVETEAAATVVDGVSLYQLTEAGIALQATLQGTKYYKDEDLN